MGFYESDRIRNKNLTSNQAGLIYDNLRNQKWSYGDIAAYAEQLISVDAANKVAYEVLKMAIRADASPVNLLHDLD